MEDEGCDPHGFRQYAEGRRMARRVFSDRSGMDAVVDFEAWADDVMARGVLGPSKLWRQGYVDEARVIFHERRGTPREN